MNFFKPLVIVIVVIHMVDVHAKPQTLKVGAAFPTGLKILGDAILGLKNDVESISDGKIKLQISEPGKPYNALDLLDEVSSGKNIQSSWAGSGYWAKKIPASPFFSAYPFGPGMSEYLAWYYHGGGEDLHREMYKRYNYNVHPFVCGVISPETGGWFNKEIKSIKDFKGLRMRVYGYAGDVLKKFGAIPVEAGASQIRPMYQEGKLDAFEFSMPAIDELFKFSELSKLNYFPSWFQQTTLLELLINKDTWKSLGPANQTLIEVACKANISRSLALAEATQFGPMKKNMEDGVKIKKYNKDILKSLKQAWIEIADKHASEDLFFNDVYKSITDFRLKYKIWHKNAFLK